VSCQRTGSLPDTFPGGKVKCPACGTISEYSARPASPAAGKSGLSAKPAPSTRPAPPAPRVEPSFELEGAAELAAPLRRTSTAARPIAARSEPAESSFKPKSGGVQPAYLYATIGGGAVGALALIALLSTLLSGSGTSDEAQTDSAAVPLPVAQPQASLPAPPQVASDAVPAHEISAPTSPADPGNASPYATTALTSPSSNEAPAVEPAGMYQSSGNSEASATTVQRIREATVFIKIKAGKIQGSGSGFVIKVNGDTVLVATNQHVANPHVGHDDDDEDPFEDPPKEKPVLNVVFRSGSGAASEQTLPATVLAGERKGNRDLAILAVKGVRNPPKPIDLSQRVELTETMSVLIYGFPFGDMDKILSTSSQKSNPAITINKGSVSSLRRNEANQVAYVQIDGSINPGNSGGPVVDPQGRLVGVAVAQLRNTNIGFAIPPFELTRMLDGRVNGMRLTLKATQVGAVDLQIQAKLIDPMNKIKTVGVYYALAAAVKNPPKPSADGNWPQIPGSRRVDLKMGDRQIASADFKAFIEKADNRRFLIQTVYRTDDGKTFYTSPETFDIPTTPGVLAAVGQAPRRAAGKLALSKLVKLANSKDCKLDKDDTGITISVPGSLHILSPELRTKNAPMVLADADGDFLVQVLIPGKLRPGTDPVRNIPFPFNGAGLLIWQDQNNYMRFERSAGTAGELTAVHRVLLEVCKNGNPSGHVYIDVPEAPTYLRIERKEGDIQCMFGPDGKKWIAFKRLAVEFPDKVQVGVSASNTSKKPFPARFEEFLLSKAGEEEKAEEADSKP
jgi:S1-C subfamily serine protease/regulation of enolase protein 1 (concanavalin A-like superfamily)